MTLSSKARVCSQSTRHCHIQSLLPALPPQKKLSSNRGSVAGRRAENIDVIQRVAVQCTVQKAVLLRWWVRGRVSVGAEKVEWPETKCVEHEQDIAAAAEESHAQAEEPEPEPEPRILRLTPAEPQPYKFQH